MVDLNSLPLTAVRGIGEQRAEKLAGLGLHTVADLLEYYPFRYDDFRVRPLSETSDGDKVTIRAEVSTPGRIQYYGRNKSRLSCRVIADQMLVTAVWFNQAYVKDKLVPGQTIYLTGKWDSRRRQITVSAYEFTDKPQTQTRAGSLQPVYHAKGTITQRFIKQTIEQALRQFGGAIEECLPEELIHKYKLMPRKEALHNIHLPENVQQLKLARRRLKYEELFLFQLKLQAFRGEMRSKEKGISREFEMAKLDEFISGLPFELTNAQHQVIREILEDMRRPYCMNRLLQGDVGSGKTVVAAIALYANYLSGHQGAIMVPTEILAEQHAASFKELFSQHNLEIALLTGSLTPRQRKDVIAALQMGLIDIVVGTHALIQEDVYFRRLGLVVTDEQHRFGVQQRSILRSKGFNPDVLSMTATPIPRTLAITAYGDMDVSVLGELPSGRKPVKTYWVTSDKLQRVFQFLLKELANGRQGYVICPLIEESDKLDLQNAIDLYEQLQRFVKQYDVGLLHGRMPAEEKEDIMRRFSENEIQILVSTTVVEVGVNVPNATVMIIYDADRFGLSQLHQLRGRVGRSSHQSYCILIADPKNDMSRQRVEAMTRTNDGFEIARLDMELRGPGEYFGTKQSGVPEFKIADLLTDYEMLEYARNDAAQTASRSDFKTSAELAPLRRYLQRSGIFEQTILD